MDYLGIVGWRFGIHAEHDELRVDIDWLPNRPLDLEYNRRLAFVVRCYRDRFCHRSIVGGAIELDGDVPGLARLNLVGPFTRGSATA